MSIFLKPVQRTNPLKPDEAKKWYPVQYTTKMVDENEVAMLIADETTLNPMEAAMAIRQLRKVVQRLLGGGDGDTPAAQGGATPAAGRQEREAGRLGHVQRHPQHRGSRAQGRPHRPQREACEHQLPARRRNESRHAESGLRVAGQNHGKRHGFRRRRRGRASLRAGRRDGIPLRSLSAPSRQVARPASVSRATQSRELGNSKF